MKSKKLKILAPILSVGALTTILVPTITLTSCSATANPYLKNFTSENSSITYTTKANANTPVSKEVQTFTFQSEMDANGNMISASYETNQNVVVDMGYFDKEWKKIKDENQSLKLPESIYQLNKEVPADSPALPKIKEIIKNKNILTIFVSVINNLKSIYSNYNSLFISKNYDIYNLIYDKQGKVKDKFLKYYVEGLNNYKSYARLWLSDIKFDLSIEVIDSTIGKEIAKDVVDKQEIVAKISNVTLTYKWYELIKDGSNKIKDLKTLQEFDTSAPKDKIKDFEFKFQTTETIDLYFKMFSNLIHDANKKEKYYETGLIVPDMTMPLSFVFRNDQQLPNQDEQNRKKTDFVNKEIQNCIKNNKFVNQATLDDLYKKIGYLTTNDLPKDNWPSSLTTQHKTAGELFVKKLFGTIVKNNNGTN